MSAADGLVEFLTARLDEDKRQAMIQPPWPWVLDPADGRTVLADGGIKVAETYANHRQANVAAYILGHDPIRVLREVAAKRCRLALYVEQLAIVERIANNPDDYTWDQVRVAAGVLTGLEGSVRLDAEVYADRPGYKEEWKPAEAEPAFDPKRYWATLRKHEQETRDPAAKDRHADMWKTPEEGGEG